MAFSPRTEDEAAQAITRLVDGRLTDAERDDVNAWAQADPEITRQVRTQQQVSSALASGGPQVPDRLVDSVQRRARSSRRPDPRARGARWAWAPAWRPALALVPVAAIAAVIVIAFAGGSSASPSITAAARLAFVPATEPAPAVSNASYLDVSYERVVFPNYAPLHATATGQLRNRIGGRPALTVFYRLSNGARLSYTVFSGAPVRLPAAARLVRYEGVPLRVYRTSDGLSVVTLVRHGATCVLAAATPRDVVLGLAAEPVLVAHA
jgi:anti-sigma factor RsiW